MENVKALRRAICTGAIASSFALFSISSAASNLSLSLDGVAAPIEILAYHIGASSPAELSKVAYSDFEFAAPESAVTPLLLETISSGRHFKTARLQVMSTDGVRLLSAWDLSEVDLASLTVDSNALDPKAKAPNIFLAPQTKFSLRFRKICYSVFATDGSVATQTCFDLSTGKV